MNIGEVFYKERKEKKQKQCFVAKKVGISQTYLSQIERGKKIPTLNVVQVLCDFYSKPLWMILINDVTEKDIPADKLESFRKLMIGVKQLADEFYN